MFMDEHRRKVWDDIRQYGLRAFDELLPTEVFVEAAKHAGVKLGNSALWLPNLVMLGVARRCTPRGALPISWCSR